MEKKKKKTKFIMKNIFIICSVRGMDEEYRKKLEEHVEILERFGDDVHLPHRDTNQHATGIEICTQNMNAIKAADEVHMFYSSKSTGTHFDMGVAFSLDKKMVVIENEAYSEDKSFSRTLDEWESLTNVDTKIKMLEDKLRLLKESNMSAALTYGSELSAGGMIAEEEEIEEEIEKLKSNALV